MLKCLKEKYLGCEPCKLDSQSQHNKPHQVIPENLQFLMPGEQISVDFKTFNNKTMLVVKDRVFGLVWAKLTKDQTSDEAFRAIVELCHRYGLPHSIRSHGAGSFCSRFSEKLREIGGTNSYLSIQL